MSLPSSSSFHDLFNAALNDYEKQTKTKLVESPLAKRLEACDSVDSITTILQEQAQVFGGFRSDDGKIMKSIRSSVDVLYTLSNSTTLGGLIGLIPFPPANAIFTGIAVLLAAVRDISDSYDKLVVLFSSFENFLSRLSIYIGVPPTPALTNVLVKILVELISTLALVTKEVKQGRFKKFVKKVRGENEIETALERLDRLTQDEVRSSAAQTLQVVSRAERDKLVRDIREWLSPPDPWKNHNVVHDSRHSETGTWLIQGDTYAKWKSSGPSSLLWINGKPGAGKSVICSAVIEDIRALQKAGLASLAFFYCDFREDKKRAQRGLLSSLLVQLGDQSDAYSTTLSDFYVAHGRGSQHASDKELLSCLKDMLQRPGQATTHIIIDALDECPRTTGSPHPREKVLNLVKDLVDLQISNLRICVTSRPEADIKSILDPLAFRSVSLEGESGQVKDIAEYVKKFVNTDSEMREWKDADKQMVIDVLSKKANGMFRWVFCQLDSLRRCIPRTEDIRAALDELPKTLDETYARTLERIDEKKWKYAHIIFQCVTVASRPLRVDELAQSLSFDFKAGSTPTFLADWRPEDPARTVLSMCSSLLAIVKPEDDELPVVQFAHFSAQEYLTSLRLFEEQGAISRFHVSTTPAHTVVAQVCLGLLLHFDETVSEDSLNDFPLGEYAAKHWVGHARVENVELSVQDGINRMFDPNKCHLTIWAWICDPEYPSWYQSKRSERPGKARATSLHYAACCGMHDVAKFLIVEHSQDVDALGFDLKETPLHVSSRRGHADIARLLLEHGGDKNAQDIKKRTPLLLSSENGHVEVARILLEQGADMEARDYNHLNPLERALWEGHVEFASLLLKHGADANSSNYGWTPLHVVSPLGRVGAVRALLEHGADANARIPNLGVTPLHQAASSRSENKGHIDVVRLLVQYGSDIHARDDKGRTPFMMATEKEYPEMMQLLLELGAEDHRK